MYFLLDKDYAVNNVTRCIGISEKGFTQEDIESAKLKFNSKDVVIYEGDDIPHYIEYDAITNTIKEGVAPLDESVYLETLAEQVNEGEKIFDEAVIVEPNIFYFYIDKNIADTEFISENIATFNQPLLNPDKYLGKESYLIVGKEMPYYITIEDGAVREATEYERYKRGQYILRENEVEYNNNLITLEEGWYIQDNELIKIEKPLDMVKPVFNEKTHIWVETVTQEELQEKYFSLIKKYKTEILETGYIYVDSSQVNHQQKCRDKDLALLGNAIAAHGDIVAMGKKDFKTSWSFNDDDVLEMELEELKVLRFRGAIFIQALFNIEAELKSQDSNINLTKQNFIDLINKNSDVKCWTE